MVLADILSLLPNMKNKVQVNLPTHVDSIQMGLLNFIQEKQEQFKTDTASDPTHRVLSQAIFEG